MPRQSCKIKLESKSTRQFYLEAATLLLLERFAAAQKSAASSRVFVSNDLLGQEILVRGVYEGNELDILFRVIFHDDLSRFQNSIALDVGGNIGNHALFFARFFKHVVTFEPNPVIHDVLCANIRLNKITNILALKFGLSDRDHRAEFTQPGNQNLGSSGLSRHVERDDSSTTLEVELRRGDDLLGELAFDGPVSLIKADVEGHELWVLRGLERIILRDQPYVLFESKQRDGEDGGGRTVGFLRDCGYPYFYSLSLCYPRICNLPKPFGTVGGLLVRLVKGVEYRVELIEELEDRHYGMIIATPRPLDLLS